MNKNVHQRPVCVTQRWCMTHWP